MSPKKKGKTPKYTSKPTPNLMLVPFLLAITVVPLIVYLKAIPLTDPALQQLTGKQNINDFFSCYKSVWLVLFTLLSAFGMAVHVFSKTGKLRNARIYYILLSIFVILLALSTVLAGNRAVAFSGFPERYEGFWVLLAYTGLTFLGINLVTDERALKLTLTCLTASAVVIGLIGLGQYFGYDLFTTSLGKRLLLPAAYEHYADGLKFYFGANTIYATLYNSNYVGSYAVMLVPITLALLAQAKSRIRYFYAGAFILSYATLWGSNSRAGMVAATAIGIIFMLLKPKALFAKPKLTAFVVLSLILVPVTLNLASHGGLSTQAASVWTELDVEEDTKLQEVRLDGQQAEIVFDDMSLSLSVDAGNLSFRDSDGQALGLRANEDKKALEFVDERYAGYTVRLGDRLIEVSRKGIVLRFTTHEDRLVLRSPSGEPLQTTSFDYIDLHGKESWGSNRGYIWSRTIPLLKQTMLIGHGPDTYPLYFPQHDYLGKANYFGDMNRIVDKPHNFFLQIAVQSGVLSLLVVLALFAIYAFDSLKLYWRTALSGPLQAGGFACFLAIVGYLVAGMFNDSIVSVAPIFWALLGLGIGCNYLVKQTESGQSHA